MKKTILLFLFTLMGAVQSFAIKIGDINYNLKGTEAEVVSGTYSGEVVIPETVEYNGVIYTVTSIGKEAFHYCSSLTSVTIPNSVTSIGNGAFYGCSCLGSVNISCKDEADFADYIRRSDISSVFHTDGLSGRTHRIFIAGEEQTEIVIPNSVTTIGGYAFYNCSCLTSVTIPESVVSFGEYAFSGCSGLPVIDNIRYADTYLIETVDKDQASYKIKDGTRFIGHHAFSGRSNLTSVTIPNSVISIGDDAFLYCSGLTSVTIPNSVTSIGNGAFYRCSGLTSVTIPNSVTEIENYVFEGCSGLTSVTIPNSVTEIGYSAFKGCSGLTSVTIPNSVTTIGDYAFAECSGLTSVTIPNSVTEIRGVAFEGCSGLTSVIIGNSVNLIGGGAFRGCSGLTSVTIPNSVTEIGGYAFEDCSSLTSVTIPNSVTSIGNGAFYGCRNLNNVYCHLRRSPVMGKDVFGEIDLAFSVLYVPDESVKGYSQTEPWSNFGSIWPMSQVPEGIKNPFNDDVQTIQYDMTGRRKSSNSAGLTITVDGNGNTRKTIVVKK